MGKIPLVDLNGRADKNLVGFEKVVQWGLSSFSGCSNRSYIFFLFFLLNNGQYHHNGG